MSTEIITEIVDFWHGPSRQSPDDAADRRDWWYRGGAPVDKEIRSRFGAFVAQACDGDLNAWRGTADGALALILLLDQFTRNIYRNTIRAYAGDALAYDIVNQAIDQKLDAELHPVSRIWLYHPFHHAEEVADQDRGIALLNALLAQAPDEWRAYVERSIEGWTRHRNIVAQFGRFPHRNAVLGRDSTEAERAFLETSSEAFGQGPAKPG